MKAMIFAAGEGRRMRPLTLTTPKPLLTVAGRSLLEHQIRKLVDAGVHHVVINVAYLAEQIVEQLPNMTPESVRIDVSLEDEPLETGGALLHAQHYLAEEPFLLVNADVWCDIDYSILIKQNLYLNTLAHLVLVDNPEHNKAGDFYLNKQGYVCNKTDKTSMPLLTLSGISIIHPQILALNKTANKKFPLRDLLLSAMIEHKVKGEYFSGFWCDIGTPERLQMVDEHLNDVNSF